MTISYAAAGDLLERYRAAWQSFDGDAWTDLFSDDIAYHEDPFEPPLVGRNAVRAYLNEAAERQGQVEMTIERHWAVGPTVLAAWHASFIRRPSGQRVRIAGFLEAEVDAEGRIARFREWWHHREAPAPDG
jgi:ketosteroid isomerase-like protein